MVLKVQNVDCSVTSSPRAAIHKSTNVFENRSLLARQKIDQERYRKLIDSTFVHHCVVIVPESAGIIVNNHLDDCDD